MRRLRAGLVTPHSGGAGARANKFTLFAQCKLLCRWPLRAAREELADGGP